MRRPGAILTESIPPFHVRLRRSRSNVLICRDDVRWMPSAVNARRERWLGGQVVVPMDMILPCPLATSQDHRQCSGNPSRVSK
jgi:hypothetical protein